MNPLEKASPKNGFQEVLDKILDIGQKSGMRNLSIIWVRRCLDEEGFKGECIFCGNPVTFRGKYGHKDGKYFCSDDCEYKFYENYWWSWVRERYLKSHSKCEICGCEATEVHHKLPIKLHPSIGQGPIWNESNLLSCCKKHHRELHVKLRKSVKAKDFRWQIKTRPLDQYCVLFSEAFSSQEKSSGETKP